MQSLVPHARKTAIQSPLKAFLNAQLAPTENLRRIAEQAPAIIIVHPVAVRHREQESAGLTMRGKIMS